jgi:hypothetical protein
MGFLRPWYKWMKLNVVGTGSGSCSEADNVITDVKTSESLSSTNQWLHQTVQISDYRCISDPTSFRTHVPAIRVAWMCLFIFTAYHAVDGLPSSLMLALVPKRQEACSCSVIKTIVSYRSVLSIIASAEALRYMGVVKLKQLLACICDEFCNRCSSIQPYVTSRDTSSRLQKHPGTLVSEL